MTKTATDARRALAPALGAGTALSAMLFASRLPVTLDFILPRRAGWGFFSAAFEALSRPADRSAFSAAVSLLLLGALAWFLRLCVSAARGRKWSPADFLTRGLHLALVLLFLRWSFAIWFEVSQKVLFPFGSMNALELPANALVGSAIVFAAMRSALRLLAAKPPALAAELRAWAAVNAFAAALAMLAWGAWTAPAAVETTRRLFVVLTEEEGRPGQTAYDLPSPPDGRALDALERGVAGPSAHRLETLRRLYEARAKLMDAAGLRRALLLGARHDDLARSLLIAHLAVAPPGPEAVSALGALADETAYRIGPMGASRLALAYARLGDRAQAGLWARRAAGGPRGIPEGLLDLSGGGALAPGRVAGRIDGLKPARVGLYRKTDPAAPYLLDAAGLVASAEPDAKGRFAFTGLQGGRYYLALLFDAPDAPRGEIRVSGHRGDLSLDARRPSSDLSPLTVKITSR